MLRRSLQHVTWTALALCAGCRPGNGQDLSVQQLSEVVAREQGSLDQCYQGALDKSPYDHEFQIQATLHIRKDGTVAKVALNQAGLRGIGPCVEQAIRTWQFPPAAEETRASLPIIFRPKVERQLPPDLKLPPGFKVVQPPQ